MGSTSAIEWTEATWNPWRGCDKVSPGCAHCYMFSDQRRYGRDPSVVVRCSPGVFYAPLRSRKWRDMPPGTHVFTCSWSDWFDETADPWRDEAWAIIAQRPDLIFQVLTKRPERIADHLPDDWGDGYPNVWLGVTIENRRYVHRADLLRETPAAVRFVSAEPLLGPLVFESDEWLDLTGIDWLICGGESGPRCRRFDVDWARDLRAACTVTGTAFFLKQLGGHPDKRGGDQALLDGRRWTEMPTSLVAQ
jgi:protein gp37